MPPVTSTPIRPTTVMPLPPPPTVPAQQSNILEQIRAQGEERQRAISYEGINPIQGLLNALTGHGSGEQFSWFEFLHIAEDTPYRIAAGLSGAIMVFIAVSKLSQPAAKQITNFTAPAQNIARKVTRRAR